MATAGHLDKISGLTLEVYICWLTKSNATEEYSMAHKKIERKKELDRRRHRRAQRLKQRIREAVAEARAGK